MVLPFLAPQDVVVRTLPAAYAQTWDALRRDMAQLALRLSQKVEPTS